MGTELAEVKVVEPVENLDDVMHLIGIALDKHVEAKLSTIQAQMATVLDFVEEVRGIMEQAAPMMEQLGPMMDGLKDHPMLKMFLNGR